MWAPPPVRPSKTRGSRTALGRTGRSSKACGWSQHRHALPFLPDKASMQLSAGPVRTPWGAHRAGTSNLTTRSVRHQPMIGRAHLQVIVHTVVRIHLGNVGRYSAGAIRIFRVGLGVIDQLGSGVIRRVVYTTGSQPAQNRDTANCHFAGRHQPAPPDPSSEPRHVAKLDPVCTHTGQPSMTVSSHPPKSRRASG